MIKIIIIIQLLIIFTEQSFLIETINVGNQKVCDSSVSLIDYHYTLKGKSDTILYCSLKSIDNCLFNENEVSIKLMVDNVSYTFGDFECQKITNDFNACIIKIQIGIEDLDSKNLFGDEYNISCVATLNTDNGALVGQSENSTLKIFRGELLNSHCSDTKPCMSDRNITCTESYCRCINGFEEYFDNYGITSCAPKSKHNEQCYAYQQCADSNSQCTQTSIGKLCQCLNNYYWDGYQCKYGYSSKSYSNGYGSDCHCVCPTCNCYPNTSYNQWALYIFGFIFSSGMIGVIFVYKKHLNYNIKKKNHKTNVLTDPPSYVTLNPNIKNGFSKELDNKIEPKLFRNTETNEV